MKIALIGATGFVGSAVLNEALSREYQVTAVVRNPGKLYAHNENLNIVKGDAMNADELAGILKGNDVVISAYNPGWDNPDIYDEYLKGARSIQEGVRKSGVKRLIVVGGAGSLLVSPGLQLIDTPSFPEAIKPGAAAARDYLNIIKDENELEWTYLSPAIEMHQGISGRRKGHYRKGSDNPVFDENNRSIISAEDLSVALLDEAEHPKHIRQRFTVAY